LVEAALLDLVPEHLLLEGVEVVVEDFLLLVYPEQGRWVGLLDLSFSI
jgi:hypothetical protein